MMQRISHRRGGFTLIELLAVMGIIAMLSALTAAGISRARSAQKARNTDATVSKLQLGLDQQWKATSDRAGLDKAKKRIPPQIVAACNNDWDMAGAVWAYMLTRVEFPNTFAEALAPVTVGSGPNSYTLPARSTFSSVPASGGSWDQQSAVLLYLILAEKGISGMNWNADDATNGAQTNVLGFRAFSDAYGQPIAFIRYATGGFNGELDAAPYVNAHSTAPKSDPLDPLGKIPVGGNGVIATSSVFPPVGVVPGSATTFTVNNRQPAVISSGPDKGFDPSFGGDDVVGYRLRREGARGN